MKVVFLVVLWMLLGAVAVSAQVMPQDSDIQMVEFTTQPSGASVYLLTGDQPRMIGVSGQALPLNVARLRDLPRLTVRFELDGYRTNTVIVDTRDFLQSGRWPRDGSIRLEPTVFLISDLRYFLRDYGLVVVPLVVLGAVGFGLYYRSIVAPRRALMRKTMVDSERLEELARDIDRSDPLVAGQKIIGKWRIVERLGSGGMATVYKVLPTDSLTSNDFAALKLIQADMAREEDFQRRFRREASVSSQLTHPSIVHALDFGDQDGLLYLVMEYIDGEPLENRVPPGGMEASEALAYLDPIFAGVAHAHAAGVVHRDLKPSNVMVTSCGRVKVMDFGLANRRDMSRLTQTGTALGTPEYMPPEQIQGSTQDPRSDQYALGVMAFELLTGRPPFQGEDPLAVAMQHLIEPPPLARDIRADLPQGVDDVLQRMLAKTVDGRYPSVSEAFEALKAALSSRST